MKLIATLALACALAGCASGPQAGSRGPQVQILNSTPLPALTTPATGLGLKLTVLFRIRADGTVAGVSLLTSSGDAAWDTVAVHAMAKWRFTRNPLGEETPIRYSVVVRPALEDQVFMTLGELPAASQNEADSLYALLENGADFSALVHAAALREAAPAPLAQTLDITALPVTIRERVRCLREEEITRPFRVGAGYFIYKRFRDAEAQPVP